ncbi:MAG: cation transporter [Kiritimatiellae bacterium]|nr:cation transporter [Kiritimatiellia bacterium]MCO5061361.1 cation transporter [Kiritimatiellia bacterium]MCO5067566.1 cation transporter [Kiritimatiellia bacterium]
MIRHYLLVAASLLALLGTSACFRHDNRVIHVNVPQMTSPECYTLIQNKLKDVEGITSSNPNFEDHTIAVAYNALKLGIKNVEFTIASAGFDANDTPASAEARAKLPEGCR